MRLRVVDWDQPKENDWLAVTQFKVYGDLYDCRPDLVGFVNGLPLVVFEFKWHPVGRAAAWQPLSDTQLEEAKNLVVATGAAEKARGPGGGSLTHQQWWAGPGAPGV